MIKISVIVPVYNTEKYLERCLTSIIQQNLLNIEIILVNDGSTDNSLKLLKEFKQSDERIILLEKDNGGLSSARNLGIEKACGEYILHIDSDDWIEENYLKDIYEYAKNENLDIVVTDFYKDFDNGIIEYVQDLKLDSKKVITGIEYLEKFMLGYSYPCVWNKLFKSELYKSTQIRHPQKVSLGEDLGTTPFLIERAKKIGKLNKAYIHYIQNPQSITKSGKLKKYEELLIVLKDIKIKLKDKINEDYLNGIIINNLGNIFYSEKFDNKYEKEAKEFLKLIRSTKNIKNKSKKNKLFFVILKICPNLPTLKLIRKINLFLIKTKDKLKKY